MTLKCTLASFTSANKAKQFFYESLYSKNAKSLLHSTVVCAELDSADCGEGGKCACVGAAALARPGKMGNAEWHIINMQRDGTLNTRY